MRLKGASVGHKVNPISFRLQINKDWQSKWFSKNSFRENLQSDIEIRKFLDERLGKTGGVAKIEIIRDQEMVKIIIYTSRPGVLIGRSGQGINELKIYLLKKCSTLRDSQTGKATRKIEIEILEIKEPNVSAPLVAQAIARQIEKRIAYKRAIKQALGKIAEAKIKGAKILVAGRLNGAEIARREQYGFGSVPLGRLRAKIDFSKIDVFTTYGVIGVKVWIYKGDRVEKEENK